MTRKNFCVSVFFLLTEKNFCVSEKKLLTNAKICESVLWKVKECQSQGMSKKNFKKRQKPIDKKSFYALLSTAFFTLHIITYKFFHITYCYLQKFTLHIAIYKFFHITYYHLQIFSHYILSSTKNFYITYCNLQIFTLHIAI